MISKDSQGSQENLLAFSNEMKFEGAPSMDFSHLQLTQSMQIESDHAMAKRMAEENSYEMTLGSSGVQVSSHQIDESYCEIFTTKQPIN